MNENPEKLTTVSLGRAELVMLDKLSLYSCKSKVEIINDFIASLYEASRKHFAKIESEGEILSWCAEYHTGCGIDLTPVFSINCKLDSTEEEDQEIKKIKENTINSYYEKLEKTKAKRKAMFTAMRKPKPETTKTSTEETQSTDFFESKAFLEGT
jgi:hypothetical protein